MDMEALEDKYSEEWRDIKDYEGYYQVSNLGRVRSVDRIIMTKRGSRNCIGKILSPSIGTNGYLGLSLCKDGKFHPFMIHQLVASTFLEKIDGCEIDHINSNKLDNNVNNLRYITHFENASRATRGKHKDNNMEKNPRSKMVFGFLDGNIVKEYDCAKKFCNEIGMNYSSFRRLMQNGGILIGKIHYKYGIKTYKKRKRSKLHDR